MSKEFEIKEGKTYTFKDPKTGVSYKATIEAPQPQMPRKTNKTRADSLKSGYEKSALKSEEGSLNDLIKNANKDGLSVVVKSSDGKIDFAHMPKEEEVAQKNDKSAKDEQAQEEAQKAKDDEKSSWWDRNKGWMIKVAIGTAIAGTLGTLGYFAFRKGGWFNKNKSSASVAATAPSTMSLATPNTNDTADLQSTITQTITQNIMKDSSPTQEPITNTPIISHVNSIANPGGSSNINSNTGNSSGLSSALAGSSQANITQAPTPTTPTLTPTVRGDVSTNIVSIGRQR